MPDGLRGLPTPEEDEQKKWLYFAIPGKGSKDPYSGQYLRLYSGIGQAEKSHIPEAASPLLTPAATAASELKSATMAETDDYVAFASEYRAFADLPGIETARVWEPEPATVYFWER